MMRNFQLRKPRCLLDVDGVICAFVDGAIKVIEEITGKHYQPDDFRDFVLSLAVEQRFRAAIHERFQRPGWCANLKPYPGAIDFVDRLQQHCEVYVVTTPMYGAATWASEREGWLRDYFGIPSSRVVHTSAKYVVSGASFIDDKPSHVEEWMQYHPDGIGVVMARSYNEDTTITRVHDYDSALACLIPPGLFR